MALAPVNRNRVRTCSKPLCIASIWSERRDGAVAEQPAVLGRRVSKMSLTTYRLANLEAPVGASPQSPLQVGVQNIGCRVRELNPRLRRTAPLLLR
jgi:hypothetical protein